MIGSVPYASGAVGAGRCELADHTISGFAGAVLKPYKTIRNMCALALARHVCLRPMASPVLTQKRVRMHTRSEAVSKPAVSQLAAKMEPFAGTNCYYLLVGELPVNTSQGAPQPALAADSSTASWQLHVGSMGAAPLYLTEDAYLHLLNIGQVAAAL